MRGKREKAYRCRHVPYTYPKRRRSASPEDKAQDKPAPPPALLVVGLPPSCSVLDLKSRFERYGSISRMRIDPLGVGWLSFRTLSAAQSAVDASLDPSLGISVDSHPVKVMWASDNKDDEDGERGRRRRNSNSSKGDTPLSRPGMGNRLSSAIVAPNTTSSNTTAFHPPLNPRQIVAYDDIL